MDSAFDLRQLLAFSTLARTGSFTEAARELGVSQSAVSHAMNALERKAGCRLFDRNSRRVVLTLAGEQFLHHAGRIQSEVTAARTALQTLRSWGQSQIRVGAPASICDDLLPHCLAEVRRRHPHTLTGVSVLDRNEAIQALLTGTVDLAIVPGAEPDDRFECHPLFTDELGFVMLPGHPWAARPPSDPAAIGTEPMITYCKSSYSREVINRCFAEAGIRLTVVAECDSTTAVRGMVRLGMGVGILARWVVAADTAEGNLAWIPAVPRSIPRRWGALSLRSKRMTLSQSLLLQEAGRYAASLESGPPRRMGLPAVAA